jgi:hypothetical protein
MLGTFRGRLVAVATICLVLSGICCCVPSFATGRFVSGAVWSLVVVTLVLTAWQAAGLLYHGESRAIRLLTAGFLFESMAAIIISWLGFFAVLSLTTQLAAVGLIAMIIAAIPPVRPAADLTIAASGLRAKWDLLTAGGVTLGLLAWGITAFNHVRYTASDSDSMWYHLPMVAEWIRTGSIRPAEAIPLIARAYPGFKESMMAFLSLPTHNEHLVLLGWIEFPMLALCIYSISRQYGVPKPLAVGTAVCATTVPALSMAVVGQAGNDQVLSLNFILSVLFGLLLLKKPTLGHAVLLGLSLGATAATKFSGVAYAGIVIVLVCAQAAFQPFSRSKRMSTGRVLLVLAALVGTAVLVAAPWYARNIIFYGNPLYPADVNIGGLRLFQGPLGKDYFASVTVGWDLLPVIQRLGDLVTSFGWFIPFAAFGFLLVAWKIATRRCSLSEGIFPLLLPPLCFIVFLHNPFNRHAISDTVYIMDARYLYCWFLASMVATASALATPGRVAYGGAVVLLLASVVNVALWTHYWWLVLCVTVGILIAISMPRPRSLFLALAAVAVRGRYVLGTCFILLVSFGVGSLREHHAYEDSASSRGWGPVSTYVHDNLAGERVAVCGDNRFFPLYGKEFSNEVFLYSGPDSPECVLAFCEKTRATYLVSFAPIVERPGWTEYVFGKAAGEDLARTHSEFFLVEFESRGSYLLKVHTGE